MPTIYQKNRATKVKMAQAVKEMEDKKKSSKK
jgi:hypothetical protein